MYLFQISISIKLFCYRCWLSSRLKNDNLQRPWLSCSERSLLFLFLSLWPCASALGSSGGAKLVWPTRLVDDLRSYRVRNNKRSLIIFSRIKASTLKNNNGFSIFSLVFRTYGFSLSPPCCSLDVIQ